MINLPLVGGVVCDIKQQQQQQHVVGVKKFEFLEVLIILIAYFLCN